MSTLPTVVVPIRTVSEMNARDSRWVVGRRKKAQYRDVWVHLRARLGLTPPPLPAVVTLVRCGPRLLDDDGSVSSLKFVRDEIARYLKTDDGPAGRVAWRYDQKQTKGYAVEITIAPQETP